MIHYFVLVAENLFLHSLGQVRTIGGVGMARLLLYM
jgi:hypothetical protein